MKKLLFVYPVKEKSYLNECTENEIKLLNETIQKRYREKGFEVYFLNSFEHHQVHLAWQEGDTAIQGSMRLDWNRNRWNIGNPCEPSRVDPLSSPMVCYPVFEEIKTAMGNVPEQLVVCGFDPYGTVMWLANRFHKLGWNTLVDVELTESFPIYSKRACFSKEKYNYMNVVNWNKALAKCEQGFSFTYLSTIKEMNLIYHPEQFRADYTVEEIYRYLMSNSPWKWDKDNKYEDGLEYVNDRELDVKPKEYYLYIPSTVRSSTYMQK